MSVRFVLALIAAALVGGPALAQSSAPPSSQPPVAAAPPASAGVPTPLTTLQAQIAQADLDLHTLSKSFGAESLSAADIKARLAAIPPIQAKLAAALTSLTPRLASIDVRLAQLGPAPAAGQPAESPQITQERTSLSRVRETVDSAVKQAKLLQVEATQIGGMLNARQRQQQAAQLWTHNASILDPDLWRQIAGALPNDLGRLQTLVDDEAQAVIKAARSPWVVAGWIAAVAVALAIAVPARAILNGTALRLVAPSGPNTQLKRTLLALANTTIATLTPLGALLLVREALAGGAAISPAFEQLTPLIIRAVLFASFFDGLGRALLAPGRPAWRLAPIPDDVAARLVPYPAAIGATAAIASLAQGAATILGASQPTAIAVDGVALLVELMAVGGGLIMVGRLRGEHLAAAVEQTSPRQAESRLPWIIAALAAWLTLGAALLAVLFGYIEMASQLMGRMIWIAAVLASLFLLLRLVDELFPALLAPGQPIGRFLRVAIGLSAPALQQVSVLLSGALRLTLLLFGWAAILAPFGAGAGDVINRITSSQLVIHVGQVAISPGALFGAAAVFLIGLFVTRAVRGWLEKRYLPTTQIDVGLRTSLASGVTYLGALAAIILTGAYLGLSLDKIALFASALSVGIGFGLQSVIGNFVSGLVLLAERPIKVGDWIAIGDLEGDVKRINVRATEIEMGDRSKLIVPNSDLISKTVRNVTHSGALGQVKLVLKTDIGADPAAVRDLILKRLTEHKAVQKTPAPAVFLSAVADGALEFTAFAYVASPRQAYATRSDVLFQIVPDLKAAGIPLASSSPVVNVGLSSKPIEPKPEEAAGGG